MISTMGSWLRAAVFVGLGAIAMILAFLPACSSDSQPGAEAPRKNERTAKKSGMPVPLMSNKESIVIEVDKKAGGIGGSNSQRIVVAAPGVTPEQLQAHLEETRALVQSPGYEVMPGLTKQMAESRLEEARKMRDSASSEVMPGVSKETVEARLAESRRERESSNYEILPGLTKEQLDARVEGTRRLRESQDYEVLPGVTKAMLEAKAAAIRGNPSSPVQKKDPQKFQKMNN